ncbi:MAG: hypothetical protein HYX77_01580 [Acidobacteria bacterium]|nr:hypothetical protein [Acidobacteriota bacterium]
MSLPRKSLRDLKTLSGRADRIANPYMGYMQITCLEMEKARKGREKESALRRVQTLDARLREIEREKADLLRALAERAVAPAAAAAGPGRRLAFNASAGGLKVRY